MYAKFIELISYHKIHIWIPSKGNECFNIHIGKDNLTKDQSDFVNWFCIILLNHTV